MLELVPDGGWKDPSRRISIRASRRSPFSSTYERRGGGTVWHWLGSSFRFLPHDFRLQSRYGQGVDWPISYDDLGLPRRAGRTAYYNDAEAEIGVSADVAHQQYLGLTVPARLPVSESRDPARRSRTRCSRGSSTARCSSTASQSRSTPRQRGRNSRPYDGRRVCAGNTNCIPICPIQAKYDPTITLNKALDTGNVERPVPGRSLAR